MATIKKRGHATKKQPEQEIRSFTHKIGEFLAANRKILTVTAYAAAILVLLAGGYSLKRSLDEQKAGPLLAIAYQAYSPVSGSNADYSKALDLFRNVQKKYPSSPSGAIAAYYSGNCLMNLGRNDEALKEYQNFVKEHGSDKFLLGLVYERLGYLYKALGKPADAIKAFEQSDKLTGPGITTVELARLYESTGNSSESQKKYKLVADKLAGTSFAMEAMGKVQKIQAPPVPAQMNGTKSSK